MERKRVLGSKVERMLVKVEISYLGSKVERTEKKSKPTEFEVMLAPLSGPRIFTVLTF